MQPHVVLLNIAGQQLRVTSTVSEEELLRLAATVEKQILQLSSRGKSTTSGIGPLHPQAILLAALFFARQAEEDKARLQTLRHKTRQFLLAVKQKIDQTLAPPGVL